MDVEHDIKLALAYLHGLAIDIEDEMLSEAATKIENYLRTPYRADTRNGQDKENNK